MDELQREQQFILEKMKRKQNAADNFIDEKEEEPVHGRYKKNKLKSARQPVPLPVDRHAGIALTQSQMSEDMGSMHELPDDKGYSINEKMKSPMQLWDNL